MIEVEQLTSKLDELKSLSINLYNPQFFEEFGQKSLQEIASG